MLGTPLISCFKASGDTVKRPGARLRAIATVCIRWVVEHFGLVGGARATGYPRKLDREIFADCPSAKIGSLENFRLYGSILSHFLGKNKSKMGEIRFVIFYRVIITLGIQA